MPENPNEYDDDAFTRWANELDEAVAGLWEAGASATEIADLTTNAIGNNA